MHAYKAEFENGSTVMFFVTIICILQTFLRIERNFAYLDLTNDFTFKPINVGISMLD